MLLLQEEIEHWQMRNAKSVTEQPLCALLKVHKSNNIRTSRKRNSAVACAAVEAYLLLMVIGGQLKGYLLLIAKASMSQKTTITRIK